MFAVGSSIDSFSVLRLLPRWSECLVVGSASGRLWLSAGMFFVSPLGETSEPRRFGHFALRDGGHRFEMRKVLGRWGFGVLHYQFVESSGKCDCEYIFIW